VRSTEFRFQCDAVIYLYNHKTAHMKKDNLKKLNLGKIKIANLSTVKTVKQQEVTGSWICSITIICAIDTL
jgi:hypothetical protein